MQTGKTTASSEAQPLARRAVLAGMAGATLPAPYVRAEEIVAALEITGGDVTVAAERLGVSRSTLFEKIKRLGLGRRQ